jgi:hypothetical protein
MARQVAAILLLCLGICSRASAAITASWAPVASGDGSVGSMYPPAALAPPGGDPLLLGMQTWDLRVTTDGNWQFGGLRAALPNGEFYNHPLGSHTRPSPALVSAFPALQFDTYVTAPGDGVPGAGAPSIFGGFPATEPFSMSGNVLSVSWGNTDIDSPGSFPIARLTFPLGVIPDILTIDQNPDFSRTSQVMPDSTTAIPEIPEPAALYLVAAAGLFAMRRLKQ